MPPVNRNDLEGASAELRTMLGHALPSFAGTCDVRDDGSVSLRWNADLWLHDSLMLPANQTALVQIVAGKLQLTAPEPGVRLLFDIHASFGNFAFDLPHAPSTLPFELQATGTLVEWHEDAPKVLWGAVIGRLTIAERTLCEKVFLYGEALCGVIQPLEQDLTPNDSTTSSQDATLSLWDVPVAFGEGLSFKASFLIDQDLTLVADDSGHSITLTLEHEKLFSPPSPFTCVLAKDSKYGLHLSTSQWSLKLLPEGSGSVGTVYVPSITDDELGAEDAHKKRCVLDLVPSSHGTFCLGSSGLEFLAVARPREIRLGGLKNGAILSGSLQVRGDAWELDVRGQAELPWFKGSSGVLGIRGGGGPNRKDVFGATFEVTSKSGWTDPSGLLAIEKPSVGVTLTWQEREWNVGGYVGGTLVFKRAQFEGEAGTWLERVFDDVAVEFDRIDLSKLGTDVTLRIRRAPTLALWKVLSLDLRELMFEKNALQLHGGVGIALPGGISFAGSLPGLKLTLDGGRVAIDASAPATIEGYLAAPSGIRVRMKFRQEKGEGVHVLMGSGSITAPTIPDVAVQLTVGRFKRKNGGELPTISVYANVPVNVPLFTGVVLKNAGVGFGVYRRLRGIDQVGTVKDAYQLIRSGGIPDPGQAESWVLDEDTTFSFVAQTTLTASTAPEAQLDYYVANLLLSLDSALRLAAFGEVWLMTSPEDTKKQDYRERPYGRGVMVIDAARPSIVAALESLPDPKMSLFNDDKLAQIVGGALGRVQTRASLEARHGFFALTLGPNRSHLDLGIFRAEGTSLFAIQASARGAHVLASASYSAQFSADVKVGGKTLKIGASARARYSWSGTFFGSLNGNSLTLGASASIAAHAELAVWLELSIRIKAWFINITIRERWELRIAIDVSAAVDIAIRAGENPGAAFSGEFSASLKVAGITVGLTFQAGEKDSPLLTEVLKASNNAQRALLQEAG